MIPLPLTAWGSGRVPPFIVLLMRNMSGVLLPTLTGPCDQCSVGADGVLDTRQRRIGAANEKNVEQLLSTLAVFPLTQRLGMSIDAVNDLVRRARIDAANAALKPYFPL